MYQYIFDETTTNKANESTKKSKDIFEQFYEVDNKYNTITNQTGDLNLEKINYTKPTNEEIEKNAKNSLESYKNSSISNINSNFDEKKQNIDQSIQELKNKNNAETQSIALAFETAKDETKDDAIRRGLARSSIVVNKLAGLNQQMLETLNQKTKEIGEKIDSFNAQKAALEEQKQSALNSFDIEYAVKLQDKINSISDDIAKKEKEITEYNNKIEKEMAQWKKEQEDSAYKKTTEIAELMGKYGLTVFDVLKQNEKYEIAKAHFNLMDKDEAITEFTNNPNYINQLGQSLYNKLLNEMQNR